MKRIIIPITGIIIALSLLGHRVYVSHSSSDFPTAAYVSDVIDGDTILLKNGRLLRYIGIDTPEMREKGALAWKLNPQPFSREASEFNKTIVLHQYITIEYDAEKTDRYDRLLGYVYINDRMINELIIQEGYAFLLTLPPNLAYTARFHAALKEAYSQKRNIWQYVDAQIITADNAHNYIGSLSTVEGDVRRVVTSSHAAYLHFGEDHPSDFTGVIFNGTAAQVPFDFKVSSLQGKKLRIYGIIKEYNGPEIIINSPEQVQIMPN
ncbi:MAG: thermonuclease family protein [bacterium]